MHVWAGAGGWAGGPGPGGNARLALGRGGGIWMARGAPGGRGPGNFGGGGGAKIESERAIWVPGWQGGGGIVGPKNGGRGGKGPPKVCPKAGAFPGCFVLNRKGPPPSNPPPKRGGGGEKNRIRGSRGGNYFEFLVGFSFGPCGGPAPWGGQPTGGGFFPPH